MVSVNELMISMSGVFLAEQLPEDYGKLSDTELDDFIIANRWIGLESFGPHDIYSMIEEATNAAFVFLEREQAIDGKNMTKIEAAKAALDGNLIARTDGPYKGIVFRWNGEAIVLTREMSERIGFDTLMDTGWEVVDYIERWHWLVTTYSEAPYKTESVYTEDEIRAKYNITEIEKCEPLIEGREENDESC